MKKYLLLLLLSAPLVALSQDSLRVVVLAPQVGEVIDSAEKAKYHLFPFWTKEQFRGAYFYRKADSSIVLKGAMKDGSIKTMAYPQADFNNSAYLVKYYSGLIKPDNSAYITGGIELALRLIFGIVELKGK